ncbi:MAG TPA: RNA pseudouridine synthase, partial [Crocinitomicaceae bacterium]|nr:RNA pseudouridine synthase [Crocinitomicaceae bacterium]
MTVEQTTEIPCFIAFKQAVKDIELPKKFTFPFYYEPHTLAKIAVDELKEYLKNQTEWEHNFGLDSGQKGLIIGKMFGVLVVQKSNGEIGYLAGFSGKLANSNHWSYFVPPVFDILEEDGFFKKEEIYLNSLNAQLEILEKSQEYADLKQAFSDVQQEAKNELHAIQQQQK